MQPTRHAWKNPLLSRAREVAEEEQEEGKAEHLTHLANVCRHLTSDIGNGSGKLYLHA